MYAYCSLAYFWLAHMLMLSFLSYIAQVHLAKDVATHSGLHPPVSIIIQHPLTDRSTNQSDLGNSSIKLPSPQVTLDCVKLTIKTNQYTI